MAVRDTMQSLERMFQLVEFMAAHEAMGARELHKRLGVSTTSIHRMLKTLVELGYAVQNEETEKYMLTYKLAALGNQVMERNDVVRLARPVLKELADKCRETVHFVERVGTEVRYIDKVVSGYGIFSMQSYVGLTLPMPCTAVGKAILAEIPREEVIEIWNQSEVIPYTDNTIRDLDCLMTDIEEAKKRGCAFDNEEREVGIFCAAVSIAGYDGKIRYGVSVSGPTNRIKGENLPVICEALRETRKKLAGMIGSRSAI